MSAARTAMSKPPCATAAHSTVGARVGCAAALLPRYGAMACRYMSCANAGSARTTTS